MRRLFHQCVFLIALFPLTVFSEEKNVKKPSNSKHIIKKNLMMINKISFYRDPDFKCIPSQAVISESFLDQRQPWQKASDLSTSLFRELGFTFRTRLERLKSHLSPHDQTIAWKKESQTLIVLLHGLRSDPTIWFNQLSYLSKIQEQNAIDVYAPIVPKRGLCSLEEASSPILPIIVDYAEQNPGRPICILGVSNGSRIATWLETRLRTAHPSSPVFVSTIAGVHMGTSRMALLKKFNFKQMLYPEVITKELSFNSDKAKILLEEVRSPLPDDCAPRASECFASTEDLVVPDPTSTLTQLNPDTRFYLLHGHGHNSIVQAVAKRQITSCIDWVNRFAPHPIAVSSF